MHMLVVRITEGNSPFAPVLLVQGCSEPEVAAAGKEVRAVMVGGGWQRAG